MKTKEYKPGDEIVFNQEVTQGPTEDTPAFLLAYKGEHGKIVRKSAWNKNEYLVQPKSHNPFYTTPEVFSLKSKRLKS